MNPIKTLILFSCLVPFAAFGQGNNQSKFSIGLSASPDLCFRTIHPDDQASSKNVAADRNQYEAVKFGFTAGLSITYKITKRLSLESGLLYSDKGERYIKDMPNNGTFNPQTGTVTQSSTDPVKVNFNFHYYYLDIPVKADYYLLNDRVKVFVTAGISSNIFLAYKTTAVETFNDGHTEKSSTTNNNTSDFNRVNFAALVGAGVGYELNSRVYIKAQPEYRRSINSITHSPVTEYPYSAGINFGCYIGL